MQFAHLKRREFITLLGSSAAWPLAALAQVPAGMRRLGVLMAYGDDVPEAQAWVAAFRREFQKLGWIEGGNVRLDIRWATDDKDTIERFAKELVASQPELILSSSTPTTAASSRPSSSWLSI
jgi:putative ABC transport system substrate-binding protein